MSITFSRADTWAKKNVGRRIFVVSDIVPAAHKVLESIEYKTRGKSIPVATKRGWLFSGRVIGYHADQNHLLVIEPQEFVGWQPGSWEAAGVVWVFPDDVTSCWWVNIHLSSIMEPSAPPELEKVVIPVIDFDRLRKLLHVTKDEDIVEAVRTLVVELHSCKQEIEEQQIAIDGHAETIRMHEIEIRGLRERATGAENRARVLETQAQQRRVPSASAPSASSAPPTPILPRLKLTSKARTRLETIAREMGMTAEELENDPTFRRFGNLDVDNDE